MYPISKRPGEIPEQMIKTKRDTFKTFQGNLSLLVGGQEVGEESLPSTGERVSGSFELVSEGECEVIIVSDHHGFYHHDCFDHQHHRHHYHRH